MGYSPVCRMNEKQEEFPILKELAEKYSKSIP
jgi:hypothetical protein